MKRAIYVDYENVSIGGLKGIEKLTHEDVVKIFIGAQASKLTMVEANRIFNSEASVELITNRYIGKNALDFIIMVHMGYDIAQDLAKSYYIISKDKGYDPAIHEMRRMSGLTVARREDIYAVLEEKKSFGKKIKGFFGFRDSNNDEQPDTTEHTVVGKGKKDSGEISRITKQYISEDNLNVESKKRKNVKTYNKDRNRTVTDTNAVKTESGDNRPKRKATKPDVEKRALAVSEKSAVSIVAEKKASNTENKSAVKNGNNVRKKVVTENAENKQAGNSQNIEVKAAENKIESTLVEKSNNQGKRRRYNKTNSGKINTSLEKNPNEKPEEKQADALDEKQSETVVEKGLENVVEKPETGIEVSEKNGGKRGNGHNKNRNRHNGRRRDYTKRYVKDGENVVNSEENKPENHPVAAKTPEELERERSRNEAFALLAELNEQEENRPSYKYIR